MKTQKTWIKLLLIVAGLIEIAVGLMHIPMPSLVYQFGGLANLQQHEVDLVTLLILAVGILLLAFGGLTWVFAFKFETALVVAFYYTVIKSILWLSRWVLEILFPVAPRIFFLNASDASASGSIFLLLEMSLFAIAGILIRRMMADSPGLTGLRKPSYEIG